MYDMSDPQNGDDEYKAELNDVIRNIEKYLKPKLIH